MNFEFRGSKSYRGRLAILNNHFSSAERLSILRGLNLFLGRLLTPFEVG